MAYINQEDKKRLTPKIKEVLKKYNVKGTLAIYHYSTLRLKITEGELDILGNYNDTVSKLNETREEYRRFYLAQTDLSINTYHFKDHFTGKVLEFVTEIVDAMNEGNHDNSDLMTDYFDVGWYIDIQVSNYRKY